MKQSKSVIYKRQMELMGMFDESGNLLVSDACAKLKVSPITIRRDLELLEKNGKLARFHGGARLVVHSEPFLPQYAERGHIQTLQKQLIAKYVASLIQDKQTVFLNAGSTTYFIIKELVERPVRIITNNVNTIQLFDDAKAELMMTGGEYNAYNRSFLGDMASTLLAKVHADMCILGVNGINAREGVTSYSYQETLLNQTMVKQCMGKRIVAADGTKIGKLFYFSTTPIENINILVTDSTADTEELEKIKQAGVEVILADQL